MCVTTPYDHCWVVQLNGSLARERSVGNGRTEFPTTQQDYPGSLVVIVQVTKLSCKVAPDGGIELSTALPDWGIGVIVAGSVAIAVAAIGLGVGLRQSQYNRAVRSLHRTN